jgi:hypothetical protein
MRRIKSSYDWATSDLEQIADAAATLNATFNRFAKKVRKLNGKIREVRDELSEDGAIVGTQKAAFTRAMKRIEQTANDIENVDLLGMSDVVLDLVRTFTPDYIPENNDEQAVAELDSDPVDVVMDVADVISIVDSIGGIASYSKSALKARRDKYRRQKNSAFGYPVYRSIRRGKV